MDIQSTLRDIAGILNQIGVRSLLIGGIAVNYHGYTRATLDIDFLLATDDLEVIRDKLIQAGYTNVSLLENVAFFQRPGNPVRVDFVQTDRQTIDTLLSRSSLTSAYGTALAMPSLEDLLAMKLFSLRHGSPERRERDMSDIVHLCIVNDIRSGETLKPLCERYADNEIYGLITARITEAGGGAK